MALLLLPIFMVGDGLEVVSLDVVAPIAADVVEV